MISNISKEQWDAKVIEFGGSILQSWVWGEYSEALGHKIYRLSGQNYICLAIETDLPFGKKYLYCPRGPLGNEKEALKDLQNLGTDRNLIFARVEPLRQMELPRAVKDIQPKDNWMLSLEKTEEEILVGMKPKTRYNINLAERKGVRVRQGEQKDLITMWKLLLETANRTSIRLHPQNHYFVMWDKLAPDNLKIFLAEYQNKPLAAMILVMFGDTATYLHGGSSSVMKESMAPYLLHWEAIKFARKSGMKNYDFGGIGAKGWEGISRFKKGFGGFEVQYPGTYELIYSPLWYNVYKQGRKLTALMPKRNAI